MGIMKIKIFVILAFSALVMAGCNDYRIGPRDDDMTPPGAVTNVQAESLPGKVKITYQLPADKNLLYVKAVYTLNSGEEREVSASYYNNNMILDGFGDTEPHEVKIYSVSRNDIMSEPVSIEVTAEENPIWSVRRSLVVSNDFSGVNIRAENPSLENISIEIMVKDELGEWVSFGSVESRMKEINASKRGLDYEKEYEFSFVVRDRFMNYTDPLYKTVNPMYEMALDKSKFKNYPLPEDGPINHGSLTNVERLWDNVYGQGDAWRFLTNNWPADGIHTLLTPMYVTFDIAVPAKLSRITIFNWGNGEPVPGSVCYYFDEHMREFEVWGWPHEGTPPSDGNMEQWARLGAFEVIKPSGLPYLEESREDQELAERGFEFIFPVSDDMPKVRYVRIKCIRNFGGTTKMGIKEMDLFGDPREETNK